MARVPYLSDKDMTDANREALSRGLNLYRAAAHAPGGATLFSRFGKWLRFEGKLDPRLRELAILTVGHVARAPYEWTQHVKMALEFGASERDLALLTAELAGEETALDAVARDVIHAAAEITRDTRMSDRRWRALATVLDTEQLVELVQAVSLYCAIVRMLNTLEVELEAEMLPWSEKYPLPPAGLYGEPGA